ncbi:MAG TPA: hypothetical protein VNR11_03355 [Xanthobacteraceae bacterium]|nr:hypothetical protein [Xanthobacteraceae bacterium]
MRSLPAIPLGALLVLAGALAGPFDSGSAAFEWTDLKLAQAPTAQGDQPAISSQRTINLTQEDRHTIREIVLKDNDVRREPANVKAEIGDPAPQGIETHEFPPPLASKIPALKSHSYFVKGDEIVVVDSKAGKIADIVK